ncbi:MAG: R3H domain-containing nucleic acid-binding protein [Nitrososphaerales archaeon]
MDETDAEFVVVSEPRQGLFGRMRGEARVRARVRPASPRPKRGRTRRTDQGSRGPRRARSGGSGRREGGGSVSVVDPDSQGGEGAGAEADGGSVDAGGAGGQKRRNSRSRGGRRRGSGQAREAAGRSGADERSESSGGQNANGRGREQTRARSRQGGSGVSDVEEEEVVGEELSLEDQGESAREFVEGLVGVLGLSATVGASVVDSDTVQISVEGAELGVLIGPGGGTLVALQELARTVVQRRTGGRTERILVDVAGYRAKRAAALQRFTKKVSEEVLASGSERALEPMSASDRKVVHDTINEIEGVATKSVGEEPRRYIIVIPSSEGGEEPEDA